MVDANSLVDYFCTLLNVYHRILIRGILTWLVNCWFKSARKTDLNRLIFQNQLAKSLEKHRFKSTAVSLNRSIMAVKKILLLAISNTNYKLQTTARILKLGVSLPSCRHSPPPVWPARAGPGQDRRPSPCGWWRSSPHSWHNQWRAHEAVHLRSSSYAEGSASWLVQLKG